MVPPAIAIASSGPVPHGLVPTKYLFDELSLNIRVLVTSWLRIAITHCEKF